jgi:hypothetical protein
MSDQLLAEASTYTGQHNIQTQETDIHAPSGIRTRYPSNQAAAHLRLRPRGHWDRPTHTNLHNECCVRGANIPASSFGGPGFNSLSDMGYPE